MHLHNTLMSKNADPKLLTKIPSFLYYLIIIKALLENRGKNTKKF